MNADEQTILREIQDIRIVTILVTIAVAWLAIVLIQRVFPWLAERLPSRFRLYLLPLVPVLRLVVLSFAGFQVITGLIQPSTRNLLGLAGTAAIAIGFAFKDYVSSLIAGIVVIYERPYRPGDWIQVADYYGEVKSVGLRAIRMVTADDTVVSVPHSHIWNGPVANANDGSREHMCIAEFYVKPDHDAAAARTVLYDVALASPFCRLDRTILVTVGEQPWSTRYRLKAYPIDGRSEFAFTSDLTVRGKQALEDIGALPAQLMPAVDSHALPTGP